MAALINCHLESPLLPSGGGNNALVLRPYPTPNKKKRRRDLREKAWRVGEGRNPVTHLKPEYDKKNDEYYCYIGQGAENSNAYIQIMIQSIPFREAFWKKLK